MMTGTPSFRDGGLDAGDQIEVILRWLRPAA